MSSAPPLRFLALVVGGWAVGRAAFLVPWAPTAAEAEAEVPAAQVSEVPMATADAPGTHRRAKWLSPELRPVRPALAQSTRTERRALRVGSPMSADQTASSRPLAHAVSSGMARTDSSARAASYLPPQVAPPAPLLPAALSPSRAPESGRWSASAWAFVRRGDGAQLASAGTLGGSQVGGRINYRLNQEAARPVSFVARGYSPIDSRGAEIALGVEWQPFARIPVRILAERREGLDDLGRSAFSLMAYGGVSNRPIVGPLRLDAYAQAGVVGLESRDAFVDGAAALSLPISDEGHLAAGAGLWGAAQPGVERLDAGPQVSWRLFPGARLAAEWRFRLAGDAEPGSGPVLILSKDF